MVTSHCVPVVNGNITAASPVCFLSKEIETSTVQRHPRERPRSPAICCCLRLFFGDAVGGSDILNQARCCKPFSDNPDRRATSIAGAAAHIMHGRGFALPREPRPGAASCLQAGLNSVNPMDADCLGPTVRSYAGLRHFSIHSPIVTFS